MFLNNSNTKHTDFITTGVDSAINLQQHWTKSYDWLYQQSALGLSFYHFAYTRDILAQANTKS